MTYRVATAADLIAALTANPQLRAEALAQMPEMLPSDQDVGSQLWGEAWMRRARVAESELTELRRKLEEAETERDALREGWDGLMGLQRRLRAAESRLQAAEAELPHLREAAELLRAGSSMLSSEWEPRKAAWELRDHELARDQKPAATTEEQAYPAQQDHAPLGQKEENEHDRQRHDRSAETDTLSCEAGDCRLVRGEADSSRDDRRAEGSTEEPRAGAGHHQAGGGSALGRRSHDDGVGTTTAAPLTRADVLSLLLELARAAEANRFAETAPLMALVETLEKAMEAE